MTEATKRSRKQKSATPPALAPTKTRRRPMIIALGVALTIVGMLATWMVTTTMSNTETVVTVSADLERGDTITAEHLTTMEITGGQNTSAVKSGEASTVIGQVATVDLPAGSLLTHSNIAPSLAVPQGSSLVGIEATPAQLPTTPLKAGDSVRIVDTPIAQGEPPKADPDSISATVHATRVDQATGRTIVDVIVPSAKAGKLAAHVATQRIAIVLDSQPTGE